MAKNPFHIALHRTETVATPSAVATNPNWCRRLPRLSSPHVTLREVRLDDAASLRTMLSTEEVSRFISPLPTTVDGFERFISWAVRERERGNYACFAVIPEGMSTAVGLFQFRALDPGCSTAEWGFVIGSAFWGTGLFVEGARLLLDFIFDTAGVHRLEARASTANGRGNGALRKMGAVQEGVLRRSFCRAGCHHDQVMWSLLAEDWRVQRLPRQVRIH